MPRLFLLFLLLACQLFAMAKDVRPRAGIDVDETRMVRQLPERPDSCIALAFESVAMMLDRTGIERLARNAPAAWNNEEERQAHIAAKRAASLVSSLTAASNKFGCSMVNMPISPEAQYLILEIVEQGQVHLIDRSTGRIIDQVQVRYHGSRCGTTCGLGLITLSVPESGEPFMTIQWWIS